MDTITPTTGLLGEEPVAVFLAGLAAIIDLGIAVATALDWVALTSGQAGAIAGFVTAVTAFIAGITRARVYSPATVASIVKGGAPLGGDPA